MNRFNCLSYMTPLFPSVCLTACAGAPKTTILAPEDNKLFFASDLNEQSQLNVKAKGESIDKEYGRLPADQLQWKVKDLLETNNSFTSVGTGEEVSFNVPVFRTENGFAEYLLVLTGKDTDGHAGTDTARFRVSIPN